MKDYIKKLCSESGIVWQEMGIYFTIKLFRIKPPSHIYTEEEIMKINTKVEEIYNKYIRESVHNNW